MAVKGATTVIAQPGGPLWQHDRGHPGLATSGSGDVLSGLIVGLAPLQVPLEQACAWGVLLHAMAGATFARRLGTTGYLARELPAEIPAPIRSLRGPGRFKRRRRQPRG